MNEESFLVSKTTSQQRKTLDILKEYLSISFNIVKKNTET